MLEMIIVSACVIIVLLAMGTYVRQAMSGKLRGMIDSSTDGQFDPTVGKYVKVSNTSGVSASNMRTERRVYRGADINSTGWVVMSSGNWTVLGNNTVADMMISNQSAGAYVPGGGAALNTTEVEHYEGPWQDL